MILDDFGKISFGEIFGIFWVFCVCPISSKNGGFGRRFLWGIGFFTNSGLRATIEFLFSEILTFWDFLEI